MTTKIWNIEYGDWTRHKIVARNVKDAIKKSMAQRKGEYRARCQDITEVSLFAEA